MIQLCPRCWDFSTHQLRRNSGRRVLHHLIHLEEQQLRENLGVLTTTALDFSQGLIGRRCACDRKTEARLKRDRTAPSNRGSRGCGLGILSLVLHFLKGRAQYLVNYASKMHCPDYMERACCPPRPDSSSVSEITDSATISAFTYALNLTTHLSSSLPAFRLPASRGPS
jgi:hypothetical protein